MKLEKWALIAEILGGVAIVVTLAFLAFEMRSNTEAVQAQTYQGLMRDLADYRRQRADREIVEIGQRYESEGWSSLSRVEQEIWRTVSNIRWGIYESAYYANKRGVLGRSEWERFEIAFCRGFVAEREMWDPGGITPMEELLTPEFLRYVEDLCESPQ